MEKKQIRFPDELDDYSKRIDHPDLLLKIRLIKESLQRIKNEKLKTMGELKKYKQIMAEELGQPEFYDMSITANTKMFFHNHDTLLTLSMTETDLYESLILDLLLFYDKLEEQVKVQLIKQGSVSFKEKKTGKVFEDLSEVEEELIEVAEKMEPVVLQRSEYNDRLKKLLGIYLEEKTDVEEKNALIIAMKKLPNQNIVEKIFEEVTGDTFGRV